MRQFTFILLPVLIVLSFSNHAAIAATLPVGQPEYDFVYDQLEHVETRARNFFDFQLGPYTHLDPAWLTKPFDNRGRLGENRIQLFGFGSENFRASKDVRGRGYALFRGGITGNPLKHLDLFGQFNLDERKARDPNYTGKKWRGFAGDIDLAYAQFTSEHFDALAGRFSSFWGPHRSVVLGSHSHLDGFGYTLRWGRLSVTYRFAQLGQDSAFSDTITQWQNRYFAGHRFDFHFSNTLRAGIFESLIWGGPGRAIDFSYLNPFIFFHSAQLNDNQNDNTFVGFDFTWKPTMGTKLYGQLLIDDVQLDHKTQGDQEPAEYALLVGLYTASDSHKFDTRLEYARVTNWTFNQILERNRYANRSQPIGDVLGNDYDLTSAEFIRWLKPNLSARLNVSYKQQGEGRISSPWTEPWLDVTGDYSEPFPTGVVEKTLSASVGLKGFVTPFLFTDLNAGWSRVVNYSNHSGDKRTLPFLECYLSFYFSRILDLR